MKVTNRTIKKVTKISTGIALAFFALCLVLFLFSPTLDYMIVVTIVIAVSPPTVLSLINNRWKIKIEKAFPEFLRDLATASRTGIPLQVALEYASKRAYGPLTDELKVLVANMSWGMNFNEAMAEFSNRIDIPIVSKSTVLITEAGKHGGDLSNIFESTANYAENVNAWVTKRKMQTFPYIAIFYFSVLIFLFIIIVISTMMFLPMSEMTTGNDIAFIKPILTNLEARRLFMHTALFESLFGGLIAGKINEDSFVSGFKHVMVLSIAVGIAFYLFFT